MAIKRTVCCSVKGCNKQSTEEIYGEGWQGWIQIAGVILDGDNQVYICPKHTELVMNFIDSINSKSEIV